jgi:leucyl aminopeptidase
MPSVSVVAPDSLPNADVVVIGVHRGADGPSPAPGAQAVDAALDGRLGAALQALGATGRVDEVVKIPTLGLAEFALVVAAGLGPADAGDTEEAARRAAGAAMRAVPLARRVHVAIDAPAGALAEGALLGAYSFTEYKSSADKPALRRVSVAGRRAARAQVQRAQIVADAVTQTRDLVNTPPNDLFPKSFAARGARLAGDAGLEVEILNGKALRRGGYGGVLGVGQGSQRPPRLLRIAYRPAKPVAHVALVGKGITFDSGGLNLKTMHMSWMKSDMGGAAAVIAATVALARLEVPVSVTATVPMAENMPSGSSYRPSDILTLRDGSTVEVADTDAEGRLILADAITRAAEDGPDRLIELSTLTGAQLVSLGTRVIGAMGEPGWRDEVVAAGTAAGEASWAMPMPDELRRGLDSPVADIKNVPAERFAGMIVAGRFLGEFVPDGLPWVHLDIAGPAFNTGAAHDYTPVGGTGAGVRTVIAAVEALARRS